MMEDSDRSRAEHQASIKIQKGGSDHLVDAGLNGIGHRVRHFLGNPGEFLMLRVVAAGNRRTA